MRFRMAVRSRALAGLLLIQVLLFAGAGCGAQSTPEGTGVTTPTFSGGGAPADVSSNSPAPANTPTPANLPTPAGNSSGLPGPN